MKWFLLGLFWLIPLTARGQGASFPAYSPFGYYSGITNMLRNPMVRDGVIQGENFEHRDNSLFSDSFYADMVLAGKGPDGMLSGATVGATWQFKYGYAYGLVSGYTGWEKDAAYGYGLVGGGVRKSLLSFLDLNMYGQISYGALHLDGAARARWEAGGYPLNHKWVASSLHAMGLESDVNWVELRNRIAFVGIHYWEERTLDVRRTAISLSRRSFAILADSQESSAWEAELQIAVIDLPRADDRIYEARLMLFFSTVGDGPKGEARPGVHLNISYVTDSGTDYDGFGVELGFGAKQLDAHRSQELYFLLFYNYSAWYYRSPSLKWGVGLGGRI